jgi:hypothetical protein
MNPALGRVCAPGPETSSSGSHRRSCVLPVRIILCIAAFAISVPACGGTGIQQQGADATAPPPTPVKVAPSVAEETVEDRLSRRRNAILSAPPCVPPPRADTSAWEPAVMNGRVTPLRLPREFQLDTSIEFRHGGAQWRADGRTFFLENGTWGINTPTACRASFRAGDYIVEPRAVDARTILSAFPADTALRLSTRMGGQVATQAELEVLWTILRSVPPLPWPDR